MKIVNPATEEVIADVEADTAQSLGKKLKQLRQAQPGWQTRSLFERIEVLKKFSDLLEESKENLASVLTSEVGKPIQQSRNEIAGARARIKWMTDNASRYLSDEIMNDVDGMTEKISYEPLGVICNISAWNYPYLVGVNVFVPALIAGNSVLYKPSEYATLTGMAISKLLYKAGVPEDNFQLGIGKGDVGAMLLDMDFDGYFFTGSYKTGKLIYEHVAKRMIPCQCELGGKDPLYVTDDVKDIAAVAAATADGAFYNNGQSCCAVERIYVHEQVYDQYVQEFIKEVRRWKVGEPHESGVYIGPLTRRDQLSVIDEQVQEAVQRGAVVATGGQGISRKGFYYEPTVVLNVTHAMRLMREESFGPVIGIMKVSNDDEAVALMNDTDYGLTASVYSNDETRARRILSKVNSGTGYWNCCDRVSAAVPWSGRKNSGFGSTLSHIGLRAFTRPKAYHLRKP